MLVKCPYGIPFLFRTIKILLLCSAVAIVSPIPMKEIVISGPAIRIINIKHSKFVKVTWEAVKANTNITISYSEDIKLTQKQDGHTLHLKQDQTISGSLVNKLNMLTLIPSFMITGSLFNKHVIFIQWGIVFLLTDSAESQELSQIHIKVPVRYVEQMCINDEDCFPTTCKLSEDSAGYSNIPSYNKILFNDNHCNIKKPARWDEWISYHYNINESVNDFYFYDTDYDKLVNILEYYANQDIFLDQENNGKMKRSLDKQTPIYNLGTSPNLADSDKDLLLDGFEFSNRMNPTKSDNFMSDYDNDQLTNLDEQIHHTDPKTADSDGDGVSDGEEVAKNADPNDPSDGGRELKLTEDALIRLTVGDHSGSNSERYTITVGDISHQSPDFGKVGSGEYIYRPGTYTIEVTWVATKLITPDYDYTAMVEKVSGSATVKIEDPLGLLGNHHESIFDYAKGKTATMIVRANCSQTTDKPECISDCEKCVNRIGYHWCSKKKTCISLLSIRYPIVERNCPCKKCLDWYNQEMKDTRWLRDLNEQFRCPCNVMLKRFGLKASNSCTEDWSIDKACMKNTLPFCDTYHPGAYGCIRSEQESATGARQQCCYDAQLRLIPSGDAGAGTPDKFADYFPHQESDVLPWKWCCEQCDKKEYCDFYIKGPRKGGDPNKCDKCQ